MSTNTNVNNILIPKKGNTFSTFGEAHAFVKNYAAQTNIVTILGKTTRNSEGNGYRQAFFICEKQGAIMEKTMHMLLSEQHNHVIYPDAKKFSINMPSVSSKYVHKRDVYNAVGRQRQQKLQELNEIEMLLRTLENDENIIASIATKPAYNDEHNQDGSFIQAIFWAHQNVFSEFAVAKAGVACCETPSRHII
ncbi:5200_t:CDS:2 [Racocetra persica]|uniref:5200_t:CDS:1 n=1 Tax=Racocetra persica TaxID=160502 RepID=A0ACA9LQ05_9GLOM|nr:5200_t:CDS:2 [Racocetra persica]